MFLAVRSLVHLDLVKMVGPILAMIDGEDKVGLEEGVERGDQDCSQIVSCSCQTKQSHSKLNIHNSPVQNYPSRPHTTFHIVT